MAVEPARRPGPQLSAARSDGVTPAGQKPGGVDPVATRVSRLPDVRQRPPPTRACTWGMVGDPGGYALTLRRCLGNTALFRTQEK